MSVCCEGFTGFTGATGATGPAGMDNVDTGDGGDVDDRSDDKGMYINYMLLQQISVQLPTPAFNVALPAFARRW